MSYFCRIILVFSAAATTPHSAVLANAYEASATWKTLIAVYPSTDLKVEIKGVETHFVSSLTSEEITLVETVSHRFPELIDTLSGGRLLIDATLYILNRPLTSITERSKGKYWVAPKDVMANLQEEVGITPCQFDSLIVLWKSTNQAGLSVHTGVHGLTMGPSKQSFGAGYTMIKFPFQKLAKGEHTIMIHEWMHQSLTHYRRYGFEMPDIHKKYGYPEEGENPWKLFCSDALQGKVLSEGKYIGISDDALKAGAPRYHCTT